jgi:L-alanine-DL-glutamate epimerase-like enolase superfamily enzyme
MNRRGFLRAGSGLGLAALPAAQVGRAALPKMKITRVRAYTPPNPNPIFNQSDMVVTVETDAGITGIGEGGARDTIEQCAGRLIGQDPQHIERLWQDMTRSFFYPPGREKMHAIGALDLALWDLKGKVLKLPVHALLGGMVRNYCECYNTSGVIPGVDNRMTFREARGGDGGGRLSRVPYGRGRYPRHHHVQLAGASESVVRGLRAGSRRRRQERRLVRRLPPALRPRRSHARLRPDQGSGAAVRGGSCAHRGLCRRLPILRRTVKVPLAAGEEWGYRWDFNKLVEAHDIDFLRATLPNVGGITEMMKIAAICETHFVGIVPHFTGPIATAALVHCLGTYAGPVLMEYNYQGRTLRHLPGAWISRMASCTRTIVWASASELDMSQLKMVSEVTQAGAPRQMYYRPDGSITNW